MRESVKQKESNQRHRLSLHPLMFDEAITDVLKIKPEPKPQNKRKRAKKQRTTKRTA